MTDRYASIPPDDRGYRGIVKRHIPNTDRYIAVYGSGEEAERIADEALKEAMRDDRP